MLLSKEDAKSDQKALCPPQPKKLASAFAQTGPDLSGDKKLWESYLITNLMSGDFTDDDGD
jgi:hypothetical protein